MPLFNNKAVSFFDGDFLGKDGVTLTNLTGAAVVQGSIAVLNLDFASGAVNGITPNSTTIVNADNSPNTAYVLANAVAVTVNNALGLIVVADGAIAAGDRGKWNIGTGLYKVLVPNGATAGQFISPTTGTAVATVTAGTQAALDALGLPITILGHLLEANASGATAARMCQLGFSGPIYGGGT